MWVIYDTIVYFNCRMNECIYVYYEGEVLVLG